MKKGDLFEVVDGQNRLQFPSVTQSPFRSARQLNPPSHKYPSDESEIPPFAQRQLRPGGVAGAHFRATLAQIAAPQ